MTTPKNLFKTKPFREAKKKIRALDRQRGATDYMVAKELEGLLHLCPDRAKFQSFLKDPSDGMGYTVQKANTAREKVDALHIVPEQKIWEDVGWQGGVRRIYCIPRAEERSAVLKEARKFAAKGNGLTTSKLRTLLKEKAPSLKVRDSVQRDNAFKSRIVELEEENAMWRGWIRKTAKKIPVLKDLMTDEQKEMLKRNGKTTKKKRKRA